MTIDLLKRVVIKRENAPFVDGNPRCFVLEVATSDLPYDVLSKDCADVSREVGRSVTAIRRRRSGELVDPKEDVRRELYDMLRTFIPVVEGDFFTLGGVSTNDVLPRVVGVLAVDSNDAHHAATAFESKGYNVERGY